MPAAEAGSADLPSLSAADFAALFAAFAPFEKVLLAVSGGPDSTALMLLAARWRETLPAGPALVVATVDHGLRAEALSEAEAVGTLATRLGLAHSVLTLAAPLPETRLQEAARHARYEALVAHARDRGAGAIATAHTLDDQAETVLFRLMRGSGIGGLSGIARERPLGEIALLRPLLTVPKAALVAECRRTGIGFADDSSNRNPRFARARLRALMPALAEEGFDAAGLARLATRMARAEAALEAATDAAAVRLWPASAPLRLPRAGLAALPDEIGLRLLGRAMASLTEGPVELGKLEALHGWIAGLAPAEHGARTLAGVLVRVNRSAVTVSRAPARRDGPRSR